MRSIMKKVLWRFIRWGKDIKESDGGRMGFHYVMVLVGLLEASMAGKREQDYCLPIDWKLCRRSTFFFFFLSLSLSTFTTGTTITAIEYDNQ